MTSADIYYRLGRIESDVTHIKNDVKKLDAKIDNIRTKLRNEIKEVRNEVASLRNEMFKGYSTMLTAMGFGFSFLSVIVGISIFFAGRNKTVPDDNNKVTQSIINFDFGALKDFFKPDNKN